MQPSLPRVLNRNRKAMRSRLLFLSLLDYSLFTSMSHCIFGSSFHSAEVFSLIVHTQRSSVATLVLAIHCFSDDVSNADEQQL